ncbi:protein phosphatase 2C 37 [Ricinus communis]|uniref:protein-serine/threonine phosphatase n=1 Tax=Ricinus communis TaxID=3988 RepID=B9SDZ6_RICCO|nr:protein phosphatase 2C 37 [Ricinus communis]EEF38139.1 protein phosphatase 2c, putative [Ricinus communis]|eukprot:XP_002524215.1 protein phosphatase 2C 37 [Ricinus communis]
MAGICCGVVSESEAAAAVAEPSSRASRRRRLELRPFKVVADASVLPDSWKRQKLDILTTSLIPSEACPRDCNNAVESCKGSEENGNSNKRLDLNNESVKSEREEIDESPKFGMTSVCGRRRDMEDAVSIQTSLTDTKTSFFGVFDGHGCSHVATKCRERLHDIVKEEIETYEQEKCIQWKETMERSFDKMDKEVGVWFCNDGDKTAKCRCELRTPQCDAVGSTAVAAVVTHDKIVVSNCGDSRAVLCRNGVAIPLSSDHKPDRPDELVRIQEAGGRVIYWDGARVLGVLAMSRAIGDNYLKPYVIPEPEVTVTERREEDECLILASDGLWDVVSNETACGVARMCLRAEGPLSPPGLTGSDAGVGGGSVESSDKACSDASILLTKLALARHSTDNVSVVVVDLRRKQHQQQSNSR